MKNIRRHLSIILPTILLVVGILICFYLFILNNRQQIAEQNEEYLNEYTVQKAAAIDDMIAENTTFIESIAYLYGKNLTSPWADVGMIREYEENSIFDMLRFIDESGDDYTSRGVMANLADRDYFQAGMRGGTGTIFVQSSKVTGGRQIGFYAPVRYEGKIIGVMVGFYGEDYIHSMLDYELFGIEGESWLCASDGTVLDSTLEEFPENYLLYLQENRLISNEKAAGLRAAFANGSNMSFTFSDEGGTTTGYAAGLNSIRWQLVRSFPAGANRQILGKSAGNGLILVMELLLLFAVYGAVIGAGVYMKAKKASAANRNANDISSGLSSLFERFTLLDTDTGFYETVGGKPDQSLPAKGDYGLYLGTLLDRITDPDMRHETREFMGIDHLKALLLNSDTASIRIQVQDGSSEWFRYRFIVLERGGHEVKRILIAIEDITRLYYREAREQLQMQDALYEAETASRAKTAFLRSISNDLRTPVNAITGYTELAGKDGATEEELRSSIRKISTSSMQLQLLIDDISELSSMESGAFKLAPVRTNLLGIMKNAGEMFSDEMERKGLTFRTDAADVRDAYVLCDGSRLSRVISALLSNACKYTPEGGSVLLSLTQSGMKDEKTGVYVLRVKDTGIGMSPDCVGKLFRLFEREQSSAMSPHEDIGFGLRIASKIIGQMDGTLEVETEQDQGSLFIVTLPLQILPAEDPDGAI